MIGYFITFLVLLAAGAAFYYFNYKHNKNDHYIWVGPGEDPFKSEHQHEENR